MNSVVACNKVTDKNILYLRNKLANQFLSVREKLSSVKMASHSWYKRVSDTVGLAQLFASGQFIFQMKKKKIKRRKEEEGVPEMTMQNAR